MSATLPPLHNVLAFRSANPARMAQVRARLAQTWPDVADVGGWLLATRPLPKSRPVPPECRARGLAFTEGVEQAAGTPGGFEAVATIARERRFDRLNDVPGDVGFLWLGERELVAVRSAAGRVPLYWWTDRDEVAVGSILTEVAALRGASLAMDPLLMALWASGQAMLYERRTPVAGVMGARPGDAVHIDTVGSASVRQWFDPWPEDLPRSRSGDFAAKAARFGSAIRRTVSDELAADGGNLLSLSGGVDSSSLAWLAHHAGRPLSALSLIPGADDPTLARELGFIAPLVEATGIAPHWTHELTLSNRIDWLARLPGVAMPVLHPVLCLLKDVVEEAGVSVLVGGEFCDEMCGGTFAYKDWLRSQSAAGVAARLVSGTRTGTRAWLRHRLLRHPINSPYGPLPEIVREELRLEFDVWRAERSELLRRSAKVHAHAIELMATNDGAVVQNWEVCSALGVRRTSPFLTREVIETVASCRPEELVTPDIKHLSRTALRGDVPDRWLDRADTGAFGADDPERPEWPAPPTAALEAVLRPEVISGLMGPPDPFCGVMAVALLRSVASLRAIG